jgi:hypothetical protein
MWRIFVLAVVVALIASSCSLGRIGPFGKADKADSDQEATAIAAPSPRPKPSAPPSLPAFDPATLIGLEQAEVITALGEPKEREENAPARVWRYTALDCEVKLFFYLDLKDEQFHLLSFETSEQNGGSDAAQHCFDQVREGRTRIN